LASPWPAASTNWAGTAPATRHDAAA
jgi:hypothetical protein